MPALRHALGLDLGTSGVKVVLLDADGQLLGEASEPLTVQRPRAGHSEQDPAQWLAAVDRAVAALRSRTSAAHWRSIGALGIAGQMHGAVLLDAAGRVLRPPSCGTTAAAWPNVRCSPRVPALGSIAGNLAMPGFTAPKLLWLQRHEPALFDRIDKVLLPKDWLRLQLTAECVSEMSDAAGTLWLDVGRRQWSAGAAGSGRTHADHMPRLVEGSAVSGHLRPDLAQRWAMGRDVVVVAGAGDNAASAVGSGPCDQAADFVSLGTSGVLFVTTDRFRPNPASAVHAFCHAVPHAGTR
jgi:xylulokinase